MKGKNPLGAVKWSQKRQQKDWLKRVYLLLIIENRVPKKPLFLWTPYTSFVAIAKLIYASTCLLEQQQPSCRFKSYLRRAQSSPPSTLLCLLCCFCLKLTRAFLFFFSLFSILRFTTISFLKGGGGGGGEISLRQQSIKVLDRDYRKLTTVSLPILEGVMKLSLSHMQILLCHDLNYQPPPPFTPHSPGL